MIALAVSLKIPDNAAYTALIALRKLGVPVEKVSRSSVYFFDGGDPETLAIAVMNDETIFNPNKHRLSVLDAGEPHSGEVWILPLEDGRAMRATAWRLFGAEGRPVAPGVLQAAIERLLCNPAIERAVTRVAVSERSDSCANA